MGNCCCSRRFYDEEYGHLRFRFIGNRRFHNISNSAYAVPNDEEEAERLIRYHNAGKSIWGGLFKSPVEKKLKEGANVIDIGCGSGTWLIDMARKYPNSNFTGIDFSPIFPTDGIPSNAQFINYNLLDGLPFEDSSFDFIHQKFLVVAFTQVQWEEKVIPELIRLGRPGGWIEFVESDPYLSSDGESTQRICNAFRDFLTSKGLNIQLSDDLPLLLENTNKFSEVRKERKRIILGRRGGKAGEETLKFLTKGMESGRIWLSASMNITPEHYDLLNEAIPTEVEKYNSFINQYRFCCHIKE
ncbi:12843_t:CDS:2 [Ambispora leptoticha]|uniref:12843_t:CDS:1 n=1 Tax=Ambispora leptoticha TaxID=144679 RepID=A0A9N9BDY8_9GLOM|nr:12843_t:CDS:2 [Ambispora leptoticha]